MAHHEATNFADLSKRLDRYDNLLLSDLRDVVNSLDLPPTDRGKAEVMALFLIQRKHVRRVKTSIVTLESLNQILRRQGYAGPLENFVELNTETTNETSSFVTVPDCSGPKGCDVDTL